MTVTMGDTAESPDAEDPGEPSSRTDTIAIIVVSVVAVVLLLARAPFAAEQLWAEDGRNYLGDAISSGPIRAFGGSVAGYYQSVPRIGGALASLVPLRAAAFTTWLWVALVTAWLVATVMVSSRTWLTTLPARALVSLGLVLLPILGVESIANMANIQFVMLFVALVVLIGRPASRAEWINGGAILVATGLTTPLLFGLLPFVAYRMVRDRRWLDPLAISWAAGLVVQFAAIGIVRPDDRDRSGEGLRRIIDRFGDSALRENFSPFGIERYVGGILAVLIVAGLLVGAWAAWSKGGRERAGLMLAVPLFGFFFLVASALYSGAPNRYMVLPGLCITWGILAAAESIADLVPASWNVTPTLTAAIAAVAVLIAWLPHWSPSDTRQSGPTWSEAVDAAAEECRDKSDNVVVRIQTAPLREQSPTQWSVRVTCGDVP
jgi:hypothetical protein